MLCAGIVGLGWWGQTLVKELAGSRLLRIERGVTLEPDAVKDFSHQYRLEVTTSFAELLANDSIDAVILATPHTSHRAQIESTAATGKHVFCEKPFTLSISDAVTAIQACRSANVAVGVGHNRRLWPSIKAIRNLSASGRLGTIMHIEGNYSHDWLAAQPTDHWRSLPEETKAGGMTGMGVHLLDCFSHLNGPIKRVCAISTRRILPLSAGDTTAALVEFENGSTGTIATTLQTPYVWRLAILGSEGWAESTSETQLRVCCGGREAETLDLQPTNHIRDNVESFAQEALGLEPFHIPDREILHTVAALEAVFISVSQSGSWEELASFAETTSPLIAHFQTTGADRPNL
jgi:predicted dehydrogenase